MTRTRSTTSPLRLGLVAGAGAAALLVGAPLVSQAAWNATASTTVTTSVAPFGAGVSSEATITFASSAAEATSPFLFYWVPSGNVLPTSLGVSVTVLNEDAEAIGLQAHVVDTFSGETCEASPENVVPFGSITRITAPDSTMPRQLCLILTRTDTSDIGERSPIPLTVTLTSGLGQHWSTTADLALAVEFTPMAAGRSTGPDAATDDTTGTADATSAGATDEPTDEPSDEPSDGATDAEVGE
ncbi:hypothetical protein KXS11_08575 [Plantibacter flavus]|uniref:hypothetical protein n=1 Tax=Plantibacter flavus TaxID=150123 RepID=UPI003F1710C4